MHDEEMIALLKQQMHEMDQDIGNYLDTIDKYRTALREIAHIPFVSEGSESADLVANELIEIAQEALNN